MKVIIKDTNEKITLSLYAPDSKKNIARKFAKKHLGISADKPADKPRGKTYVMTRQKMLEIEAVLAVAQRNMHYPAGFNAMQDEQVHPLIESDINDAWSPHKDPHRRPYYDRLFSLKNAVDAEEAIWKRLLTGNIHIKKPSGGDKVSETIKFPHFRHTKHSSGDHWDLQVYCDFVMVMPDETESFDFTAGLELRVNKSTNYQGIIFSDDEAWLFPFSMSADQEETVLGTLYTAIRHKFATEGI